MTLTRDRRLLVGFATVAFFSVLAPDAWRNTIGWYGYGVVAVGLFATSVALLIRHRSELRAEVLPWPLLAFSALCLVSVFWSNYPAATALAWLLQLITTTVGVTAAVLLTGSELIRALGRALRVILALSVVFELIVAVFVRAPVLPVWVTGSDRVDPPLLLFWSRNLLFDGGPIQGLLGSSSLLSMVALLGVIVFAVQTASGRVRRASGIGWMLLGVVLIALTRSATIVIASAAVALVLGLVLLVRGATSRGRRIVLAASLAAAIGVIVAASTVLRSEVLGLLGKTDTLTNRAEIWDAVIGLAEQRPALGWGWISFWAPWVEPYRDLVSNNGVIQLHAHNAWLDVWVQLGVVGLVVFGALVATSTIRAFLLAVSRVGVTTVSAGRFSALSILPLLLLTALLVQSLAESRILIEGGWLLLVAIAVTTKNGMLGRPAEAS